MMTTKMLECDYLVVGAGASPLAFIDTLLTELPEAKVILIDKKPAPGGHWVDAYGYCKLHQPSIIYGIASKQLEGNWLKLLLTRFTLPWNHRATKQEILTYFGDFVNEKVASERIDYYPSTIYNFESSDNGLSPLGDKDYTIHYFSSVDGSASYKVKVNEKFIDGTHHECVIPHDSPLQFPVDKEVCVMTPNQIFDAFEGAKRNSMLDNKYVVLGAGKTGMDCIVYLQETMKVKPDDIAWVISNDVWVFSGSGRGTPWDWPYYLAKHNNDKEKAALALEEKGLITRINKDHTPTIFKFPMVYPKDMILLRNIKTVLRRGRVTAIRRKYNDQVSVEFENEKNVDGPWSAFAPIDKCVFVHATSPGPFNGCDADTPIFNGDNKMKLQILFAPPISFSMSMLAKFEAARSKGTLDIDFMRKLVLALGEEKSKVDEMTENGLLNILLLPLSLEQLYQPLLTQSIIFAILDKDPMVAMNWMKLNRLSFLSIPGHKSQACSNIRLLSSEENKLVESENQRKMLKLVGGKIASLEGM